MNIMLGGGEVCLQA